MSKLTEFISQRKNLQAILDALKNVGASAYLVGGAVRDLVLCREVKDVDIEVHGIKPEELEAVLKKFGHVRLVGKQFGVFKIDGLDVDWSLPRYDSKGRKPTVVIDPNMSIEEACRRRDVTMNAMAINLHAYEPEIIDPFNGLKDIKEKRISAVDKNLFLEDPLRFFRVMQFVGRFEMQPDDDLNNICKTMDLSGVARERIFQELEKLFLKSKRPSLGIRWLHSINRLKDVMPEIYATVGVKQNPKFHPEGDVFEHTMQALDAAAQISKNKRLAFIFGVLCHDIGKSLVTERTFSDEELHAYGHEKVGEELAEKFIKRFSDDANLIVTVKKMVLYHLMPAFLVKQNSTLSAYKRLARKISPELSMHDLAMLMLCDGMAKSTTNNEYVEKFLSKAKEALVEHKPEAPILMGRHLLGIVPPGPKMGELLDMAYEIQIEEGIKDLEELQKRVLAVLII